MNANNPGCLTALLRLFGLSGRKKATVYRRSEPVIYGESLPLEQSQPAMQDIYPYRLRDDFLSRAELSFYHVLQSMAGEHMLICPKVSLAELFFVANGRDYQAYQNKIDRKRVDFLLCDPKTLKPVLAIELDDSSHQRPDRQERDAFVGQVFVAARLPLVRVPVRQAYDTRELAALFRSALGQPPAALPETPQAGPPLCPKCGLPMVLRTAKRGGNAGQQFWGCMNYPRCQEMLAVAQVTPQA